MSKYHLVCTSCDATYPDDGARLACSRDHGPALLRTVYDETRFTPGANDSILRYASWLPDARAIDTHARTGVYRSTGLGAHLGLRELWIAFSGWWPACGATLPTGSFKDLEAVAVLARRDRSDTRTLVISSAGNTALAFARACTDNEIPALIIVPMRGWRDVMSRAVFGECVRVVAISDVGYDEAIGFAKELCAGEAFLLEGGVRNVGRRDGMGTALLAAVEAMGSLPDAYFQAVGSAAGALAAHEASLRVIADGRYGTRLPRLMLAQNAPFTPIHDAWQSRTTQLVERSHETAQRQLGQIGAFVLSNAAPPYGIPGGIHAALTASGGQTFAVGNAHMHDAMSLFSELEGRSIEPAAGVAVAALIRAVRDKHVGPDDRILLHVTGGGRGNLPVSIAKRAARPTLVVERSELATTALERTRSIVR